MKTFRIVLIVLILITLIATFFLWMILHSGHIKVTTETDFGFKVIVISLLISLIIVGYFSLKNKIKP